VIYVHSPLVDIFNNQLEKAETDIIEENNSLLVRMICQQFLKKKGWLSKRMKS